MIWVKDSFLKQTIQMIVQRCVEHGIWLTLWSTANHLQILDRIHRQIEPLEIDTSSMQDMNFAFWMLAFGYASATFSFCVEHYAKKFVFV